MVINSVKARQIFDSRGNPTVEVDVTTENGELLEFDDDDGILYIYSSKASWLPSI